MNSWKQLDSTPRDKLSTWDQPTIQNKGLSIFRVMDTIHLDNDNINIKESGELKVRPDIIKSIQQELCKSTRCHEIDKARKLIKKTSRAKFKVGNDTIVSVPTSIVKQWSKYIGMRSVPGLDSNMDVEAGKYEGGFKVWESTTDLIKFITEDCDIIHKLHDRKGRLKVLELGAGASLPSLALINLLIDNGTLNPNHRFHIQDYNWQVLASTTLLNFAINLKEENFRTILESKSLRFFHDDWAKFRLDSNKRYDLIMMSEVIYNHSNYESLHDLLEAHLKPYGYIVIATKDTYFGLTGGLNCWLDFVEEKKVFRQERIVKNATTNIPRSILIMSWL